MNKVALAIHDLSCYSKSSLTVVLPVLEALGIECAVLPTALISTQTDGYDSIYFSDETEAMRSIFEKHQELGIEYDGIYSGFLGSSAQIEVVENILDSSKGLKLVDPVLGDNGKLYQTMTSEHVSEMRTLVSRADIITPNYTEASLLTGIDYKEGVNQKDISEIVSALKELGPKCGVITSINLKLGIKANVAYIDDELRIFPFEEHSISFPGAGDLFASILFSLLLGGKNFFTSSLTATEIASDAVAYTSRIGRERRRGISLYPVFEEIRRRML